MAFTCGLFNAHFALAEEPDRRIALQLEVTLNGQPVQLIGAFQLDAAGGIWASREELQAIGLKLPNEGSPGEVLPLASIAGLTYRYAEPTQEIFLTLEPALRETTIVSGEGGVDFVTAESATGAVVNYTVFAEASRDFDAGDPGINGGSLALDGRAFSRYGVLSQSGIVGTTTFSDATALRLDSMWTYSDQDTLRTYSAGDFISGGLAWTRPIRMAGAQARRNFDLRPTLITMPLPSFSGSAAVPSTVEVFVNNVRTTSQQIGPGPYLIQDVPVVTGAGNASIVVTDSSGRQTRQEAEFFASSTMLRKGLYDFSVEAGAPRLGYGTESFDYAGSPAASASLRYGMTDWLTGEAHAEANQDMVNAGAGIVASHHKIGEISAAIALSSYDEFGVMVYAGWQSEIGRFSVSASTFRSFGGYADLSTVTAADDALAGTLTGATSLDQLSVSYGFTAQQASLGLGAVHIEDADGEQSFLVAGTATKSFPNNLSLFASGYVNMGNESSQGGFVGLSYPFNANYTVSSGASYVDGKAAAVGSVARNGGGSPGDYSWRVSHGEGEGRYTSAGVRYHAPVADVQADAFQRGGSSSLSAAIDGGLAVAGGGVFLAPRIDDAFAVVDAGAPSVPVHLQNRLMGETRSDGKLLVPSLNSYEQNKISIDVDGLPLTADVPRVEAMAVPREKSGVLVDLRVKEDSRHAIVIVVDGDGNFLEPGTLVSVTGQSEALVVGFGGEVYMTGLTGDTAFESTVRAMVCKGRFEYRPGSEAIPVIGPVACV